MAERLGSRRRGLKAYPESCVREGMVAADRSRRRAVLSPRAVEVVEGPQAKPCL